jgi:membrane associated rhomboid family serine protease
MNGTRYFALALGVGYLGAGLAGFVPAFVVAPPPDAPALAVTAGHGRLFGLFPINALHNIIHLALGAWGAAAFRRFESARTYARGLAVIYGLFAVMGLIPVLNTTFGLAPIHGHDVWLHAASALGGLYFGWFHHRKAEETPAGAYAASKPSERRE